MFTVVSQNTWLQQKKKHIGTKHNLTVICLIASEKQSRPSIIKVLFVISASRLCNSLNLSLEVLDT